ncbi:MAG TPA: beta-1,3-glucanase family protein [Pseudonocardiaceae bacterium]|jgi:hypothetical protein|nr:beta-1,3-glucanase family protein [Pseudonocardiaceae bacterium]
MPTRRNFLHWSLAAAASVPLVGLAARATAHAATQLPVTIVNNTGSYANSAIWLYIVGSNAAGQQCYVRSDGTLVPVSPSLNGSDGYADLSIPLAAGGSTTVNLPNMSGRIYFSITDKLKFKVVTDGNGNSALQYPAGWVSGDPSYSVLHDWVEFTFNDGGMFCNTTMVDMFSVPLAIQLSGASQQTTGTLKSGGRAAIFAAIAAQPDFARLIVGDSLRVLAPGHGIDAGLFSSTYFDDYINSVWSTYANTDLDVTINSTTYAGRVSGNSMVFSNGGGTFAKPTTQDVLYCAGALAPPAGAAGPVAADLGAAYNRSTLLLSAQQPITDSGQFYGPAVTNHYAQVMHQNTVDGKAYGFPFDDVSGFASYIADGTPNAMTITLTPFS